MKTFSLDKKIYYHDTDAGGVVYYASYLKHLEEGRTEYCRNAGIDIAGYAEKGIIFPVVHLDIDYRSPARYGDTITVVTNPEKMGNASLGWRQEVKRGEAVILTANTVWACVKTPVLKPVRIPEEIRSKIAADTPK
jgi:acyl-CoA thioester hydrolase